MKVFFGGIVSKASGKLVNMVFSVWRGLPVVREFVSPSQPNTPRQLAVRSIFSEISKYWANTLTEGLRNAWDMFELRWTDLWANTVSLTGLNLFQKFNFVLRDSGKAFQTTTPPPITPSEIIVETILNPPDYTMIPISKVEAGELPHTPFMDIWVAGDWKVGSFTDEIILFEGTGLPQGVNPVKSDFKHMIYQPDSAEWGQQLKFYGPEESTITPKIRIAVLIRRYNKFGRYSSTQKISFVRP